MAEPTLQEQIVSLRVSGVPAAVIAKKLNVTRNSVLGVLWRHKQRERIDQLEAERDALREALEQIVSAIGQCSPDGNMSVGSVVVQYQAARAALEEET